MGHTEVTILVPVLNRPHRVAPLVRSIEQATQHVDWAVLFITDPDDTAEQDAVAGAGCATLNVDGGYPVKINAGLAATESSFVFLAADDVEFHDGWFPQAMRKMRGRVGVVGTNDCANPRVRAGRHATHFLVSRAYAETHGTIDRPGHILHEGYAHNFVDDELIGTARRRRVYDQAMSSLVVHLHPNWNPGVATDTTYLKGQSSFEQDRAVYNQRRRMWGGMKR